MYFLLLQIIIIQYPSPIIVLLYIVQMKSYIKMQINFATWENFTRLWICTCDTSSADVRRRTATRVCCRGHSGPSPSRPTATAHRRPSTATPCHPAVCWADFLLFGTDDVVDAWSCPSRTGRRRCCCCCCIIGTPFKEMTAVFWLWPQGVSESPYRSMGAHRTFLRVCKFIGVARIFSGRMVGAFFSRRPQNRPKLLNEPLRPSKNCENNA